MRGFGMDFATPQTLAKIQDEQAERERARRVKEANLAAYDAARREERSRSGGSVYSFVPRELSAGKPDDSVKHKVGTVSNVTVGAQTGGIPIREEYDVFDTQSRVGSEFADLARRSAMAQRHNTRLGTDSVSAAMRAAMANGGMLPQNLVGLLSRNLGMDGSSQSVYRAGFLNNGDFDIDIVTRGANGGLQRTTKKISPREQLGIVNSTPGVWGNDGIAVSQRLYDGLRNTMGESELPPQGVYADNLRAYNTQKQSADTIKMMTGLYQAVYKDLSKGGKQPVTTDMIRARMASDMLKNPKVGPQITSVPDLNEDGTQKMVEDENGQQVPAMRQADPNNPDDVERVKQNLKMRLDLVPELAPRQDAQGGGEADRRLAFLKYIYDRENPPTPPDVLAFQQRQRERQMREVEEAQARKDITRRPQQVINYFKDGRWYSGNGYIRDGRVYDGQGYEIEGATPAEMARNKDGSVYSNENGWVARALPSARELVGGRGSAEAQGGGAEQAVQADAQQGAQGERQPTMQGAQQTAAQGEPRQATQERKAPKTFEERNRIATEIDMRKNKFTPEERDEFLAWLQMMPKRFQSSIDYDMAAYWKSLPEDKRRGDVTVGEDEHLPDTWKKPNHPTFSTESIYHREGDDAGTWDESGNYVPSTARLERDAKEREHRSLERLRKAGASLVKSNGRKFVNIIGFDSLPEDDIYRNDLDENGAYSLDEDGHSIEEAIKIQEKATKMSMDKNREREKLLKDLQSEKDRLRREALSKWPDDADKRENWVEETFWKLRYERDPVFRKRIDKERQDRQDVEFAESMDRMMLSMP